MRLEAQVKSLFDQNSDYKNPSQAVNLASSLETLSSDLYTDSNRFIYELLQNADDSYKTGEPIKIWIKLFGSDLVVAHTGSSFSDIDVRGICNINNGTKKSDLTKTGYKGIGFKAVFGQSKNVSIYSDNEFFSFNSSYQHDWKWTDTQEEWEKRNNRQFVMPWQIIPIYTSEADINSNVVTFIKSVEANVATIVRLSNASEATKAIEMITQNTNIFIFLKNICEITFDLAKTAVIKITQDEGNIISIQRNQNTTQKWLVTEKNLHVPDTLRRLLKDEKNMPDKLLEATDIQLTLAAKIGKDGLSKLSSGDQRIYAYLPTEERKYEFPVLVNTSFLTSANRENLHVDSKWNQWIFKETAQSLFEWISQLVQSEYGLQAYHLLPKKISSNGLGSQFNDGFDKALENIPFVLTDDRSIVTIGETIVDFTGLSSESFINTEYLKMFVELKHDKSANGIRHLSTLKQFNTILKQLGAASFSWKDLADFFKSPRYKIIHSPEHNVDLILHFKSLLEDSTVVEVTDHYLKGLPFILSHKGTMNPPGQVCFPESVEEEWNDINTDLSFINTSLYQRLLSDISARQWLESLGVIEKTDITYITQKLIPNIDSYVNNENAVTVVTDLFNLDSKQEISKELFSNLRKIRLLTTKGGLLPAEECYFSDFYKPRLLNEDMLDIDIFVNEVYCEKSISGKEEWKIFLKKLGVTDGITIIEDSETSIINADFLTHEDKYHKPAFTTFHTDNYKDLSSLTFVDYTEKNFEFAQKFWIDVMDNIEINELNKPVIGFWGLSGRAGRNTGSQLKNYIPWFINNIECIPTTQGFCNTSKDVFLNSEEIQKIAATYLPVFHGPVLSQDWKSFFSFKTVFSLDDYLQLLTSISDDNIDGFIKTENIERVQYIYSRLLNQAGNFSSDQINKIESWGHNGSLVNSKGNYTECSEIKYFIDGNESVFQDQYTFISLSAENKKHPFAEKLFRYFGVEILEQSHFRLEANKNNPCTDLMDKLIMIAPSLTEWIVSEELEIKQNNNTEKIQELLTILSIYEADNLEITYERIHFVKSVNTHFYENSIYITTPWYSNSVLLTLSDVLAKFLGILGHEKKIDFLLRSSYEEIKEYFIQENIPIPDNFDESVSDLNRSGNPRSFAEIKDVVSTGIISLNTYHITQPDYQKLVYVEGLVDRSVDNVLSYLKDLPEYDCSGQFQIARSIIGGITKNGLEVTIVARPSDNDQVILYYGSEFDVLNYVNAELWYEDGESVPKKMTMGQMLEKTKVNRIPIPKLEISKQEISELANQISSESFEFAPVPFTPQRIAQIISSFANLDGGKLVFGMQETPIGTNNIVGLSVDYKMNEIMEKTVSIFSSVPKIEFDWIQIHKKLLFIIEVEKSFEEIFCDGIKYIREGTETISETNNIVQQQQLMKAEYTHTKVIIIAIEDYHPSVRKQIKSVKYAKADALAFKEMLKSSMGILEDDIMTFIDEDAYGNALENDLDVLFNNLTAEDRLIFYYAGHGFHDGITNYLSTYDIHPNNIVGTSISLNKILLNPLKKSECNNALIFIDACATEIIGETERAVVTDFQDEEFKLITHDFPYYAVFLSCQVGESSFGSNILEHGIWTYHLIEAMKGNHIEIMRDGKYLTDIVLQQYLSNSVPDYTKTELNRNQNPKSILESHYENVINEFGKTPI
ncbi:sacsin N-terminal ATP-binding-like domain-containing protein [Enterococcus sp. DIV1314a]|uniref:sacsin N-terminal ATP-binding-like domain-containing protein n=1 Tax=Enterococcus sp. DIV1314a TaxID=2774660 RepID=UPI003F27D8AF